MTTTKSLFEAKNLANPINQETTQQILKKPLNAADYYLISPARMLQIEGHHYLKRHRSASMQLIRITANPWARRATLAPSP
jgi:hypothetical protein